MFIRFTRSPWIVFVAVLLGAALGGSAVWLAEREGRANVIPRPDFTQVLPSGYLAQRVWRARLSGGSVPEVLVTSVRSSGGAYGYHPVDLQVVSWDGIARRWRLVFDAQKVRRPDDPGATLAYDPASNTYIAAERFRWSLSNVAGASPALVDAEADASISKVAFVHLDSNRSEDLVFSTQTRYGASGYVGALVVVRVRNGKMGVEYAWSGDGRVSFTVAGTSPRQHLVASASYWTPDDAHCCPARAYQFAVGLDRYGTVGEISDTRPWLGLYVKQLVPADPRTSLRVLGTVYRSPAEKLFHRGDLLLRLEGAPRPKPWAGSPGIIDQIAKLDPGQIATFLVRRGKRTENVSLTLGSMADTSSIIDATPPDEQNVATF